MLPEPKGRACPAAPRALTAGCRPLTRGRCRAAITTGAAAIAGLTLIAGLAGCAKFDAALGKQWANVDFQPNTPVSTVLKVRAACSHIPNIRAQGLPKQADAETLMYSVTYITTNASNANLAQLQECLQHYPSVAGIDFEDAGDEGG
jgi:hypothetical protein